MLTLLFVVCSLAVTGLAMLIRAAFAAPYAVEDKTGFHVTSPVEETSSAIPGGILNASDLAFFHH